MTPGDIDLAVRVLQELEADALELRMRLESQSKIFGTREGNKFVLVGKDLKVTVSASTFEVDDAEALRIATMVEPEAFAELFRPQTHFAVASTAEAALKCAPPELRELFAKAARKRRSKVRVQIEAIDVDEPATAVA
jgi:hypothetical protein